MESLLVLAKEIPAQSWLVASVFMAVTVVGLCSAFAHRHEHDVERDVEQDEFEPANER